MDLFYQLFAQIIPQLAPDSWMPQPAERLRFDLADALTRHAHHAPDFFEGVGLTIQQAVAQLQDTNFARRQAVQHLAQVLAQQVISGGVIRWGGILVFDEVTSGFRVSWPRTSATCGCASHRTCCSFRRARWGSPRR